MQTRFSEAQLANPAIRNSEGVIRNCVHCGFCTATCPTYVLLGDENDSPRGRIYLIREMLESGRAPSAEVVKHIDRCLSCLSCMTTCPSGVNYMQLVDHARAYVEEHYRRPWHERLWRSLLAATLPHAARFRLAATLGRPFKPLAGLLGRFKATRPAAAMLGLLPSRLPRSAPVAQSGAAARGRVLLLQGCAEPVLAPHYRAAAVRLLNRMGYEVGFAPDEGCCGALVHHLGHEADALAAARRNVDVWAAEIERGATAILTTVSGCGTVMKNYGFMLRDDPAYAEKAATVSARVRDISEFLDEAGLPPIPPAKRPSVAYHAACSLQHGQKVTAAPKRLLAQAGYDVRDIPEGHLCCGSAGTYNILQPEIAGQLRDRKAANIAATGADILAAGNIGCLTQIASAAAIPTAHIVELLDWATGGPRPQAVADMNDMAAIASCDSSQRLRASPPA